MQDRLHAPRTRQATLSQLYLQLIHLHRLKTTSPLATISVPTDRGRKHALRHNHDRWDRLTYKIVTLVDISRCVDCLMG